ncbi:hypothetical protein N7G274_000772 [Stereocaulon virgatum]|uniref:Uncharacterized protein n=1 Tax=Stereocaulon virgatum TaxID=373712 RepID=A0ABR4AR60_9LECA
MDVEQQHPNAVENTRKGVKTANKGRNWYNRGSNLKKLLAALAAVIVIALALGLGLGLGLRRNTGTSGNNEND